jgi:L-lactate dehydrogenase (cytochrome)
MCMYGSIAHMNNALAYRRYWFRPRILRGTKTIDTSCQILGIESTLPIFVSPAAMAGLGAPEGEVNITKGAGKMGIIQGVSNPFYILISHLTEYHVKISSNASCTVDEIANARVDSAKQPLFFQVSPHHLAHTSVSNRALYSSMLPRTGPSLSRSLNTSKS